MNAETSDIKLPCAVSCCGFTERLHLLQALYATAMEHTSATSQSATALPELYTEGLDAEQIWLQLDMQLGGALKRARRLLRKAGDTEQLINPAMEAVLDGESTEPAACLQLCPEHEIFLLSHILST